MYLGYYYYIILLLYFCNPLHSYTEDAGLEITADSAVALRT